MILNSDEELCTYTIHSPVFTGQAHSVQMCAIVVLTNKGRIAASIQLSSWGRRNAISTKTYSELMSVHCSPGKATVVWYSSVSLLRRRNHPQSIGKLGEQIKALRTEPSHLMVTPVPSEVLSMSAHSKALKTTEETALQILLLCQIGIGIVANILLFIHNFSPVFAGIRLKPTQVILSHVAVANVLILLITGFPNSMMVFAPRNPLTDLRCKLQYFIRLVARSINLCSTCVLSTHQFVTLIPGTRGRVMLRGKAPNLVSYSCYSCWLLGVLNNIYIPMKVTGPQKTGNDTISKSKMVCSTSGFSVGIVFLRFAHDAAFISIMAWTSVSMVLLLYRHRQRAQCIHTPNHRGHAETRAAHTILLLVVTFVSFYLLNFICIIFQTVLMGSRFWLRHVGEVLAVSFPTVSPLLLLSRDPKDPCSLLFKHCKPG